VGWAQAETPGWLSILRAFPWEPHSSAQGVFWQKKKKKKLLNPVRLPELNLHLLAAWRHSGTSEKPSDQSAGDILQDRCSGLYNKSQWGEGPRLSKIQGTGQLALAHGSCLGANLNNQLHPRTHFQTITGV
jgi:hypothetical protein